MKLTAYNATREIDCTALREQQYITGERTMCFKQNTGIFPVLVGRFWL
jgi:hypothetical protein